MQKVVLVTGATRGIGRAIALEFGKAGFAVAVTGRTLAAGQGRHDGMGGGAVPGSIEETVTAIEAVGGTGFGARLDLLDRASIDAAIAATLERFGRIDVLVNNGIYQGPVIMQPIMEADLADGERAVTGNFTNQFHLSREVLKHMIAQGGGRMIFMTTWSSSIPPAGTSGLFYNAPKAAFNKIPEYINFEHGKDGIEAFLIEPRFTMTDTLRAVMGEQADAIGKGGEAHDPAETARTSVWLASHPDAARFTQAGMINATTFFTDNGIDPE
ncbi:MAG: SDR family NAD(P)-dependent oxidoreductase [Novosphingobium sp.]|nr:SDR family NAD(P)-dependent oxidoreductase [Novosphingobium sp.]